MRRENDGEPPPPGPGPRRQGQAGWFISMCFGILLLLCGRRVLVYCVSLTYFVVSRSFTFVPLAARTRGVYIRFFHASSRALYKDFAVTAYSRQSISLYTAIYATEISSMADPTGVKRLSLNLTQ